MRGEIRHKDSRVFDLAAGVTRGEYAELEESQGKSHAHDPLWFCGGCGGGLHVVHGRADRNRLFGYHFAADDSCKTLVISRMTEEHKREIEHHVLVGESIGVSMATEVHISPRRRADVVADGRVLIEVQRSEETAGKAIGRARASFAGDIEQIAWCTDFPGHMDPKWIGKVPGYRLMQGPYDWSRETPPPRSVKVAGVSNVVSEPHPFKRGVWHPRLDAVAETLVDDVMAGMVDGSIRAVVYGNYVRLITASGIALYEELTEAPLAPYGPGRVVAHALPPAGRIACLRPLPPGAVASPVVRVVPVVPVVPVPTSCAWCRTALGEEDVKFRLTVHPRCADERAEMKAQYRQTEV